VGDDVSLSDAKTYINTIRSTAGSMNVDPNLAQAIAEVESGCDPTKMRYEKNWSYLVTPEKFATLLNITVDTETQLQMFSYGPLQVMGSVARELGYAAALNLLCQPQLGILYGCRKLHACVRKYPDLPEAISSFNCGTPVRDKENHFLNQTYVDSVTQKLCRIVLMNK
jgi:hypothetical protein